MDRVVRTSRGGKGEGGMELIGLRDALDLDLLQTNHMDSEEVSIEDAPGRTL